MSRGIKHTPSDICIVLNAFPGAHEDGWVDAQHVAHRLKRMGFEMSPQHVGAALARIARMDAPPIEVKRYGWGNAYRVTRYGETWVHNKLPDIWWAQQTSRDNLRRAVGNAA